MTITGFLKRMQPQPQTGESIPLIVNIKFNLPSLMVKIQTGSIRRTMRHLRRLHIERGRVYGM